MQKQIVKRPDFIKRFVDSGLNYEQAEVAYRAMIAVFEDGVANKSKIHLAKVGALDPVELPPRECVMGFIRDKEGVTKTTRHYILGSRTKFKFKIYKAFGRAHGLHA